MPKAAGLPTQATGMSLSAGCIGPVANAASVSPRPLATHATHAGPLMPCSEAITYSWLLPGYLKRLDWGVWLHGQGCAVALPP